MKAKSRMGGFRVGDLAGGEVGRLTVGGDDTRDQRFRPSQW